MAKHSGAYLDLSAFSSHEVRFMCKLLMYLNIVQFILHVHVYMYVHLHVLQIYNNY